MYMVNRASYLLMGLCMSKGSNLQSHDNMHVTLMSENGGIIVTIANKVWTYKYLNWGVEEAMLVKAATVVQLASWEKS